MRLGTITKPALGHLARALLSSFKPGAAASPSCDDCQLPAAFRAEVADMRLQRQVRVHQCLNCAKIIWEK